MAPARVDDPSNLLLSCGICGRQKSDYHPDHSGRRRHPTISHGFHVLDVRQEDLAKIFLLQRDGGLGLHCALDERGRRRAVFNITLLRLDLRADRRERVLEMLELVEGLHQRGLDELGEVGVRALDVLERELAEQLPLLEAFDLPNSLELRDRLRARRDAAGSHRTDKILPRG